LATLNIIAPGARVLVRDAEWLVRRTKMSQSIDDFGEPIVKTRLESLNPEFKPIILDSENDVAGVAKFIGILEEEVG